MGHFCLSVRSAGDNRLDSEREVGNESKLKHPREKGTKQTKPIRCLFAFELCVTSTPHAASIALYDDLELDNCAWVTLVFSILARIGTSFAPNLA